MIAFIFKRILYALPVFAVVVSATFLFMRAAPGSPFGSDRKLSADVEERLLERYQLNGSLGQQFLAYWSNILQGNLGDSLKYRNRTVTEIIGQTLPKSALIGFGAILVALGIGVVAGSFAAIYHGSWRDHAAMGLALAGICLPSFVLAPLLVLLLAIQFPVFPVAGWGTALHLVLPIACLGIPYGAYCARLMRTSMLDVLNQDFIRTARAKGLDEHAVTYRHALRVASLPLVNYAGPLAANVLTGSLVVEEIFKIPGMGPFFVNAVLNRDIFLVGGCVIVYFSLLIVFNLCSDIATALLDRRIRLW